MTVSELLIDLRGRGVALHVDGEDILYDAPVGTVTANDVTMIRRHKLDLLVLLERFEERAGIMEFDGGLDRAEAERLAWEQVYQVTVEHRIVQQLAALVEHVTEDGRVVLVHPDHRRELDRLGLL